MSEKLLVDGEEWDAEDVRQVRRTADQMTIWKREGDARIAELEAAIRAAIKHADNNGMRDWKVFVALRKIII